MEGPGDSRPSEISSGGGELRRRRRLSPGQIRLIDEYLDRQGPRKCALENSDCKGRLTHDHVDGNCENNSLFNFRWLCTGHQNKERSRLAKIGRQVESVKKSGRERVDGADEAQRESSEEVRISIDWRPRFQDYVARKILERKPLTSKWAIKNGAQHIRNLSQGRYGSKNTCTRWLDELCSDEGPFEFYTLKEHGQCVRFRWDAALNGPPPWEIQVTRAKDQ